MHASRGRGFETLREGMRETASPPIGPGHNFPPAPVDEARGKVDALIATANAWAERFSKIEDEETAKSATDFLDQLLKMRQQYEAARDDERRPFGVQYDAVTAKWHPLLYRIGACERVIDLLHRSWLRLRQQRHDEKHRQDQQKAEEARRRAEERAREAQAAEGSPGALNAAIAAQEAAEEAEKARKAAAAPPQRAQVRGNLGGRARSLRYAWKASIVDYDAAYGHFRGHIAVQQLLVDLTNQAVRAKDGPRPPGGANEGVSERLPFALIYREEI